MPNNGNIFKWWTKVNFNLEEHYKRLGDQTALRELMIEDYRFDYALTEAKNVEDWCNEFCTGMYGIDVLHSDGFDILFELESDAMAFKLAVLS